MSREIDLKELRRRQVEAETFKERIFPIRNFQLAKWLGVTPVTIVNMFSGKTPIKKVYWLACSRPNIRKYISDNKDQIKENLEEIFKTEKDHRILQKAREMHQKLFPVE
jgi:hypothetical protein